MESADARNSLWYGERRREGTEPVHCLYSLSEGCKSHLGSPERYFAIAGLGEEVRDGGRITQCP